MKTYEYRKYPFGAKLEKALPAGLLVADVGGRCFGHDAESRLVFDHHFDRPGNFPSASAAVLAHAPVILERVSGVPNVVLATHEKPDFDALCSVFIARRAIEEGMSCGLEGFAGGFAKLVSVFGDRSKWWKTPLDMRLWSKFWGDVPPSGPLRAWILLAAYASHIDQCWPIRCSNAVALHSALYAALHVRGRILTDDAYDFFLDAEKTILAKELNPLTDPIFDASSKYAPELAVLQRESDLYRRDLSRARRVTVNVPSKPWEDWYAQAAELPLRLPSGELNPIHLCRDQPLVSFDGLYLRDPECLLFKEWARADSEESPNGSGFVFLAIAHSEAGGSGNTVPRYFISLDPERCGNAHLYPVWASLQNAEISARSAHSAPAGTAREHFEGRLANTPGCDDPWFDGSNYRCTIIDTPRAGTSLRGGRDPQLTDDAVGTIVQCVVEWGIFVGAVAVTDYSLDARSSSRRECRLGNLAAMPSPQDALRVAEIMLHPETQLNSAAQREAVGRILWRAIEEPPILTVPSDFLERHLVAISNHTLVVWNRQGLALARIHNNKRAEEFAGDLHSDVKNLACILGDLKSLAKQDDPGSESPGAAKTAFEKLERGRQTLGKLAQLKLRAAGHANAALRRFIEAHQLETVTALINGLNAEAVAEDEKDRSEEQDKAQRRRDHLLNLILAVGTALGLWLAWNQVEGLSVNNFTESIDSIVRASLGIMLAMIFASGFWIISRRQSSSERLHPDESKGALWSDRESDGCGS